jgi:penicillin-binding protein 1A
MPTSPSSPPRKQPPVRRGSPPPPRKGRFEAFTRTMWVLFVGGTLALLLYVGAVSINFMNLFGRMPNLKTLENPKSELASEIYSADGVLLGKYFRENRTPVEYKDLPQNVIDALIATEDVRFEEHSGIDFKSIMRAVAALGHAGGGSTLSQQVAKNLFKTAPARRAISTMVRSTAQASSACSSQKPRNGCWPSGSSATIPSARFYGCTSIL